MSKVDAQRAMREARYAAERAAGAGRRKTPAAAAAAPAASARTPAVAKDVAKDAPTVAATDDAGLCGHRSMNNRTCRRPAGHAEKNHRYS